MRECEDDVGSEKDGQVERKKDPDENFSQQWAHFGEGR